MARMVPMGNGSSLILTVTRACNLRCSYCPTAKAGWPSLSRSDVEESLELFASRYGGGEVKLFGGEPLLVPDVVHAALERARSLREITRVQLSTNGLGLDARWLSYLATHPKAVLTLSLDGPAQDHRRFRRSLPGVLDSYDHVMKLWPVLLKTPRLVVTQTIAPATAARAADNFRYLRKKGVARFNLLPGYYLPWRAEQLKALRASFDDIASQIARSWEAGEPLSLRNLFTRAATPFFNSGLVVDSDRTLHASNLGLAATLESLRSATCVGTLDDPPSMAELNAKSRQVNALLEAALPSSIWRSTLAVDAELTRLCNRLYPLLQARQRARSAERGMQ